MTRFGGRILPGASGDFVERFVAGNHDHFCSRSLSVRSIEKEGAIAVISSSSSSISSFPYFLSIYSGIIVG